MPPSQITRVTWTDDSGSGTDGTIITNAVKNSDIYAKIDEMFAGAGLYATFTFGGLVAAEGAGVHNFAATIAGAQSLRVRNSSTAVNALCSLDAGNSASAFTTRLVALSTTYSGSAYLVAGGSLLEANGAGGLSVATTVDGGHIRFYTGASVTEQMRIKSNPAGTDDGIVTLARGIIYTPGGAAVIGTGTQGHGNQGVIYLVPIGGPYDIQGLTAGVTGQVVFLINNGAATLTLKHENATASAANRFWLPGGTDVALATYEGVTLVYNGNAARWVKLK